MQLFLELDLKNAKNKDVTDHESIKLSLDLCHLHKSVGVCIHVSRARLRTKTVLLLIFYLDYFLYLRPLLFIPTIVVNFWEYHTNQLVQN